MQRRIVGRHPAGPADGPATAARSSPGPGEVIVEVAGCGVCHTDLGFFYDGVPTRHPFPLTLGHEISGVVVAAGAGADAWLGRRGRRARGHSVRRLRRVPGRPRADLPGAGLSRQRRARRLRHARPRAGQGPVPRARSVEAARQSGRPRSRVAGGRSPTRCPRRIRRSSAPDLRAGDLAVWVGVGGVGGFGVQISAALGAHVVAIDIDDERLAHLAPYGVALTLNSATTDAKTLRKTDPRLRAIAPRCPSWRLQIFEASGHPAGQALAFGLLGHGALLSVVGYTAEAGRSPAVEPDGVRRRWRMGNWGCLPEHYPAVVRSGAVRPDRARAVHRTAAAVADQRRVRAVAPRLRARPHRAHSGGRRHDVQGPRSRPRAADRPVCATKKLPLVSPGRQRGCRACTPCASRSTIPSQLNSYTTDMVKGVILGMRRASNDRARRRRRLHRLGQPRVLHRRQHRRVRRVLRRQARGIPAVHAALQRHGVAPS